MPDYHPNSGAQSENERGLFFSIQYNVIIASLIAISCTLLEVKYQTEDVTPFETHYGVMMAFFITMHVHAILLVAEIKLRTRNSGYHEIFGKISLFTGALASILLLMILVPPVGWFTLVLWAIYFLKVAYHSYRAFLQLLYSAIVRIIDLLKTTLLNGRSLGQQNRLPV